jgi:hypothetical protein
MDSASSWLNFSICYTSNTYILYICCTVIFNLEVVYVLRIQIIVSKHHCHCMRFEVLTSVKMPLVVFWVVTPCEIVGGDQRFGGTYCLPLQGPTWSCNPEDHHRHLCYWFLRHFTTQRQYDAIDQVVWSGRFLEWTDVYLMGRSDWGISRNLTHCSPHLITYWFSSDHTAWAKKLDRSLSVLGITGGTPYSTAWCAKIFRTDCHLL